MLRPGELLIGEHNFHHFVVDPTVDGERKARGLIPRDYGTHPLGCYAGIAAYHAVDLPLIPASEYSQRIRDKVAEKSQLSDVRMTGGPGGGMIPARDQNGRGYCWRHSPTSAQLMLRALANEPYADLSAYAGACRIKRYRDEGGWGAQGVDDAMQFGDPTSEFWPQRAVDHKYDTPATWENAKKYRIVEGWIDLAAAQYDRKLSFDQVISLLLSDVPVVADFSWWFHSVCLIDAVDGASARHATRAESGKVMSLAEFDRAWGMNDPVTGGIGVRLLNSWGDSWSDHGMGTLAGSKAIPDGAVGPRTATAAA